MSLLRHLSWQTQSPEQVPPQCQIEGSSGPPGQHPQLGMYGACFIISLIVLVHEFNETDEMTLIFFHFSCFLFISFFICLKFCEFAGNLFWGTHMYVWH